MKFKGFNDLPQAFLRGVIEMFNYMGCPIDYALAYDNARLATLEPEDELPGETRHEYHTNAMTMQEYVGFVSPIPSSRP